MAEGLVRMSNAAEMTIGSIPPVPFQQEGQPLDSGQIIAYFLRDFVRILLAFASVVWDETLKRSGGVKQGSFTRKNSASF